jgi:hypothetical protein
MTDTLLDQETTTVTTDGDHDLFAHYARKTDLERSMFEGIEITALCGKKWRPSRDFAKFPVCPDCKAIFDTLPPTRA